MRYNQVVCEKAKIDAKMASFPPWVKPLQKLVDEQRKLGEEYNQPQLLYKSDEFVSPTDK